MLALVVSTYKAIRGQNGRCNYRRNPRNGSFTVGNSERAAKKRRIAERLAQLVAEFNPSPAQKQLLAIIAGHLDAAERGRSLIERVRASNTARRMLRDIPRKPPSAPRPATDQAALALELLQKSSDEV